MHAKRLYEHIKEALAFFELDFHEKEQMKVEFKTNQILFSFYNETIIIKINGES